MIHDMECLSDGKKFVKKSIPYQSADVFKSKTELSLSCRIGKAFSSDNTSHRVLMQGLGGLLLHLS